MHPTTGEVHEVELTEEQARLVAEGRPISYTVRNERFLLLGDGTIIKRESAKDA